MTQTILVTGATGTIGSQVVSALKGRPDVAVRAAVRNAAKAASLTGGNVKAVDFEFTQPELMRKAVHGVDAVFLVTPTSTEQVDQAVQLIDFALLAGVKRVVKLSAIGADSIPGIHLARWHRIVERYLAGSGLKYTLLRPNSFMENFINFCPPDAAGNISMPWGQGACSFISGADIAAVAAAALTSADHDNTAYELTGPEALTMAQAASTIGAATGRKIQYVDVPESAASKGMSDMGMPSILVDAMMQLHAINKAGYCAALTDSVRKVTGRAPTTFSQFVQQHAARWK